MVDIGLLEVALLGGGFAFGYIMGQMNGGAKQNTTTKTITSNSNNTTTDNRNSGNTDNRGAIQGENTVVSGKGKNVG